MGWYEYIRRKIERRKYDTKRIILFKKSDFSNNDLFSNALNYKCQWKKQQPVILIKVGYLKVLKSPTTSKTFYKSNLLLVQCGCMIFMHILLLQIIILWIYHMFYLSTMVYSMNQLSQLIMLISIVMIILQISLIYYCMNE